MSDKIPTLRTIPKSDGKNESPAWKYIDKETKICHKCSKTFAKKTATRSMITHLKSCNISFQQTTISTSSVSHAKQKQGETKMIKLVVVSLASFAMLDTKEFREFCKFLHPSFRVSSRVTISKGLKNYTKSNHLSLSKC